MDTNDFRPHACVRRQVSDCREASLGGNTASAAR
jgi:hypothetical protein